MPTTSPDNQASCMAVVKVLFQTGNHIDHYHGPVNQDGYFGAISTFILLLSMGFSLSLGVYISKEDKFSLEQPYQQLGLMAFVILACSVMIWMIWNRDNLGTSHDDEHGEEAREEWEMIDQHDLDGSDGDDNESESVFGEEDEEEDDYVQEEGNNMVDHLRRNIKDKLPIIGIVFFFLMGVYLDIITMMAHFHCLDVVRKYCTNFLVFWYTSDSIFHIFRLVFMSVALTFTIQFDGISFYRNSVTHYSLFTIAACTLVLWFDTLLHDFYDMFPNHMNSPEDDCNETNVNKTNSSLHVHECLHHETGLYTISENLSPYFHPLNIEFFLLLGEQLAHLLYFITDRPEIEDPSEETTVKDRSCSIEQNVQQGAHTRNEVVEDATERTPLLANSNQSTLLSRRNRDPDSVANEQREEHGYKGIVPMSILLGIFLNICFVVVAFLGSYEKISVNAFSTLYSSYRGLFFFVQIICILLGFKRSVNFPSKILTEGLSLQNSQRGLKLLVIISSAGAFTYVFFSLFAFIGYFLNKQQNQNVTVLYALMFMINILMNLICVYLQTSFMIHATQVQCPRPLPDGSNSEENTPPEQGAVSSLEDTNSAAMNMVTSEGSSQSNDAAVHPRAEASQSQHGLPNLDKETSKEQESSNLSKTKSAEGLVNTSEVTPSTQENDEETHPKETLPLPPPEGINQGPSELRVTRQVTITKRQHNQYKNILFYLAICNVITWVIDSIAEITYMDKINLFQENYYELDAWTTVAHIAMPLVLFFRFTSAFILFGVYLDVRK